MRRDWVFDGSIHRVLFVPDLGAVPTHEPGWLRPDDAAALCDLWFSEAPGVEPFSRARLLEMLRELDPPPPDALHTTTHDLKARLRSLLLRGRLSARQLPSMPTAAPPPQQEAAIPVVAATSTVAPADATRVALPPLPEVKKEQPKAKDKEYVFVWDAPYTSALKQYVNLPKAWDKQNGKEVELEGHVEPRDSGIQVTMNLLPDATNDSHAGAASLGSTSVTSGGEGKVKVKLTLPVFGGAKFKVGGKTRWMDKPEESGPVVVWRKFYYQVTEMRDAPDGTKFAAPADMISALKGAFDPVFIELAPGTRSQMQTDYKAHLTNAERWTLENSLKSASRDNRSPFKMNIVLVDAADIVGEQEYAANDVTAETVSVPVFSKWKHEDTILTIQHQVIPAPPPVASPATAAPPAAAPAWQTLPTTAATVNDLPADTATITVRLPARLPGQKSNVKVKYRYRRGAAGGWGGTTGTLYMCIGPQRRASAASPTGAELQQALTHETGHALGLVNPSASWIDPDPRDSGYSLRHCGHKTGTEPRCVMWFQLGGSGARLRFCTDDPDGCAHFLLQSDCSGIQWI
jgi:hypothetical protein